jgi:hypothetical protein
MQQGDISGPPPIQITSPPTHADHPSSKCSFSTMFPDDGSSSMTSDSVLSLSSRPPVSTASTATSYHTTSHKCSKTSAAGSEAKAKESKMSPAIALLGMQGSILHLTETMKSTFMDPMVAVQKAMETLFLDAGLPEEHRRFMLSLFTSQANIAIVYTSIPDTPVELCRMYIMDLFNARSAPAATPQ